MFSYTRDGVTSPALDRLDQASNYVHYIPTNSLVSSNKQNCRNSLTQGPNLSYARSELLKDHLQAPSDMKVSLNEVVYPDLFEKAASVSIIENRCKTQRANFEIIQNSNDTDIPNSVPDVGPIKTGLFAEDYRLKSDTSNGSYAEKGFHDNALENELQVENLSKTVPTIVSPENKVRKRKRMKPIKVCQESIDEDKDWTYVDYKNPFVKDSNGFSDTQIDTSDSKIIDASIALNTTAEETEDDGKRKLYKCDKCSLLFAHNKRYRIHCIWHTYGIANEKRRRIFHEKRRKRLANRQTVAVVKDADGVECDVCGAAWSNMRQLLAHRSKLHKGVPRPCEVCKMKFTTTALLNDHMLTEHSMEEADRLKVVCNECNKTFRNIYTLCRHQAIHKEQVVPCLRCDKRFGSEQKMKIHMRVHERHERGTTHHCSYCGKGYYDVYTLAIHERTHRGEKPFKCDICHSAYGTNSTLRKHIQRAHSESPHECAICHRTFKTEKSLKIHYVVAHKETDTESPPRAKKAPFIE